MSSRPTVSLATLWLELTLDSQSACSNQQSTTTQIQHGKNQCQCKTFIDFLQLVSLCRLMWHCTSNTHWLPAAFKGRLVSLSLRVNKKREKQGEKGCQPLKDKKISHCGCNDGVGQGGGSARGRQMSIIKINHLFLVNSNKNAVAKSDITPVKQSPPRHF